MSLGLANGDFFTHVMAFSAGFIASAPRTGHPLIFMLHGTKDRVLPIDVTSRLFVPLLRSAGYTVHYLEFDGPHSVPRPIAREAFEWLTR